MRSPADVEAALNSLALQTQSRRGGLTRKQVQDIVAQAIVPSTGFDPQDDAEVELLNQGTWATGAWTVLNVGAPDGSRFAEIEFELSSTADADEANLQYREVGSANAHRTVAVAGDEDDANPRMKLWIRLDAGGNIEYFATITAGTPNGAIRYCRYSM